MTTASPAVVLPMRRIIKAGLIVGAVLLPIGLVLVAVGQSLAGWGVVLGAGLPFVFFMFTSIVALRTATVGPEKLGAIVLGTWLIKLIGLIVVLAWLRGQDFFDRGIFFGVFLVCTIGLLVLEALIVLKTRVPYVDPA